MLKHLQCSSKGACCNKHKSSNPTDNDDELEQNRTNFCLKHPRPLIVVLSVCTALSILSMIDCHFVTVHVGFVPANVKIETTSLDVGVFSFQDSDFDHGKCSYNVDPYRALGFNKVFGRYQQIYDKIVVGRGDGSSKFTVPGDNKWTVVRVSSIISASSYAMTLSLALLTEISRFKFRVETISNLVFLAAIFEAFKFGCMFLIQMCVSTVWLDNTYIRTEGSYLKRAQSCEMGRSAIMVVAVLAISIFTLCATHRNKMSGQQPLLPNDANGNPTRERKNTTNLRRNSNLFMSFFNFSERLSSGQKSFPTTITLDMPLGGSTNSLRSASHYSIHENGLSLDAQQPLNQEEEEEKATFKSTNSSQKKKTSTNHCKPNPSAERRSTSSEDESGLVKTTHVSNDKNDLYKTSEKTYGSKPLNSTTLQSEPYHRVTAAPESCEYEMLDEYESESDKEFDQDYLSDMTGGDQPDEFLTVPLCE